MKRRDFVKTSLCIGCAGALGAGVSLCKKEGVQSLSDIKDFLAERKFLYKNVDELPKKIRLDICNLCQLNCVACNVRKNEDLIKKSYDGFGYVSFKTFKNFVDNHPFIKEIEIVNKGEAFLNPELEDIVRYSYEKGISLTAVIGANLNTLSEKMAESLVKYQFKLISVSIDGATPKTYSIYRRGGDFNRVIHNIKTINKYKEKYNSIYPILTYKFILFGHNIHEIDKAKQLAKELKMPINFSPNYDESYSPISPADKKWVLDKTGVEDTITNDEIHIKEYINGEYMYAFCSDIYKNPQINYNGNLLGCSLTLDKAFNINVFEEGLMNALNNKKVLYAKLMLSDFKVKPSDNIHCSNCDLYNLLKEKNITIKDSKNILKFT